MSVGLVERVCQSPNEQVTDPEFQPSASDDSGSAVASSDPTGSAEGREGEPAEPLSDYPTPRVLTSPAECVWDESSPPHLNYAVLGRCLAASGDIYRLSAYAGGLLLGSPSPYIMPLVIDKGGRLGPVLIDRVRVRVVKDGKLKGYAVPTSHLKTLLVSEVFLQQFRPVDEVTRTALYLDNFDVVQPGYNDGGRGNRIYYSGPQPAVHDNTEAIDRFLNVMAFATEADRTNAVAAALTVLLHNHFCGAKPIISATATRSGAGKDTAIAFAAGRHRTVSISYQPTDWVLEQAFVGAVKAGPDTIVVCIENARLYASSCPTFI